MLNKQDVADIQLENRRLRQAKAKAIGHIEEMVANAKERAETAIDEESKRAWRGIARAHQLSLDALTGQGEIKV